MSIQTEQHACKAKPDGAMVQRKEIDGRRTEWCVWLSDIARDGKASIYVFVRYCPFCGEELEHD